MSFMPEDNKDMQTVYSEEMEEIVGRAPGSLIRWGTGLMLALMVIIGSVCFFVKYADVINAPLTVMARDAPRAVIAKTDTRLVRLFIHEKAQVAKGSILGFMESTAIHEEVLKLSKELDTVLQLSSGGNWQALQSFRFSAYGHLGELQAPYQVFMQSLTQLQPYLQNGLYIRRREMILHDMRNNEALKNRLQSELAVQEQDLQIAKQDFSVREQLYKEKILALLEYKQEQSKFLNKQLPLENTKTALINNEISTSAKQQELVQLEQQIIDRQKDFIQALNAFINEVKKWEAQYLLIAPVSGVVTFSALLNENQDVKAGQELCFISPANNLYYGEMLLGQENVGKIKTSQLVFIKLDGYPYQEYGRLTGHITFISRVPDKDKKYRATVSLDNGLQTDYGRKLEFRNALTAGAEVVTNKTRLAFKFLYTLRYLRNRH